MTAAAVQESSFFERIRLRGQPIPNPDSVITSGEARFTVLTARLIRLEYAGPGGFDDRASYAFVNRYAPAPPFAARTEGDTLVVDTGALVLRYVQGSGPFSPDNLSISFTLNGEPRTWKPGDSDPLNLRGTRRTLDGVTDPVSLEPGLLSRAGWALFDDSRVVRFDREGGWIEPALDPGLLDWYFFGYGHDYKAALAEYTQFGGAVPLVPRYVLGAWWSRYWAYSDEDLKRVVMDFAQHDLPLDVLVVDMDWHTPDAWTGYTWNRELFPDPEGFLRWVHERGLRATLNLHPAEGVQAFEEVYPRFAEAMGLDPADGQGVPFRITDRRFARHYFELIHHPMEDQGVDFWWMDWQQGTSSEMTGLDPLIWLNHLHFTDSARRGSRPMLYSRWGGLGNHRYPIGFSGDSAAQWPVLEYLPYFTATAANVLYGWWSHDIGGHHGPTEPELFARWVQYGALSPCLRLHATKDPLAERRPWAFPDPVLRAARAAFHLRYRLVPYLYTLARVAADSGLAPNYPMYYEHPEDESAYAARDQFYLGEQVIAAPIVRPADPQTGLASADVWIPPGEWIEYTTKETFAGPCWVRLVGDLNRLPLLVKAGAILPLGILAPRTDAIPQDQIAFAVYPGREGRFRLYEDDGLSTAYLHGQAEWTEIAMRTDADGRACTVSVSAPEGRCDSLPPEREYEIRLEGTRRPDSVTLDGEPARWRYDAAQMATIVHVPRRDRREPFTIAARAADGPISALGEDHNRAFMVADVERLLGEHVAKTTVGVQHAAPLPNGSEDMIDFVLTLPPETPGRADAIARLGGPFLRVVDFLAPEDAALRLGRVIVGGPTDGSAYDLEVTWTRRTLRSPRPEGVGEGGEGDVRTIALTGLTDAQIVDSPFAFDGTIQAATWEVQAVVTWRRQTVRADYRSPALFPAIPAFRIVAYDADVSPLGVDQLFDSAGGLNPALDWRPYLQSGQPVAHLNQAFDVQLWQGHEAEIRAGGNLAAHGVTTVVCPDEREAVIEFWGSGPMAFTLNGHAVEIAAGEAANGSRVFPIFKRVRRSMPVRLRAGENCLITHSAVAEELRRSQGMRWWAFGVALLTPEGGALTDVAYRA